MRILVYAAVPIMVTVYLFFQKVYYKRRLSRGLDREAKGQRTDQSDVVDECEV